MIPSPVFTSTKKCSLVRIARQISWYSIWSFNNWLLNIGFLDISTVIQGSKALYQYLDKIHQSLVRYYYNQPEHQQQSWRKEEVTFRYFSRFYMLRRLFWQVCHFLQRLNIFCGELSEILKRKTRFYSRFHYSKYVKRSCCYFRI